MGQQISEGEKHGKTEVGGHVWYQMLPGGVWQPRHCGSVPQSLLCLPGAGSSILVPRRRSRMSKEKSRWDKVGHDLPTPLALALSSCTQHNKIKGLLHCHSQKLKLKAHFRATLLICASPSFYFLMVWHVLVRNISSSMCVNFLAINRLPNKKKKKKMYSHLPIYADKSTIYLGKTKQNHTTNLSQRDLIPMNMYFKTIKLFNLKFH